MSAQRIPMVAGNWKMNTTVPEALTLLDAMLPRLNAVEGVERVVCPPFISLAAVSERLRGTSIRVGAQNLHPDEKGALTGEVSGPMLRDLVNYVIVGHSERRQLFGEDDSFVRRKVQAAQANGLVPILCVGETLEQHERDETAAVVTGQIRAALDGLSDTERLVVAYEPIWAIGTGRAATSEGANETIGLIRQCVSEIAGHPAADLLRILYGGSVTAENFEAFIAQPDIDGGLVGGASLKADQFVEIARLARATVLG